MKVLFSGSLDVRTGGPALTVSSLIKGVMAQGVEAVMLMPPLTAGGSLIREDIPVCYTRRPLDRRFEYTPSLSRTLAGIKEVELYHIQGLWQHLGHGVAAYARKKNIPYIITLHGMLYPQVLTASSTLKKMALSLYQKNDLLKAACVHATCGEEYHHYRALGLMNPVAMIANPVDVKTDTIASPGQRRVGYLGRVHRRKNIERMLYAWQRLGGLTDGKEVVIIGDGDAEYLRFLKEEVSRLQLKNIIFTGFLTGDEKEKAVRSLSYLMVPSDFENFGMIIPEALQLGIPVIASKGTPWQELESRQAGWWVDNDLDTLTETLAIALNTPEDERIRMGENGQRLVREGYATDVIAKKTVRLYRWILDGGERPEFVYID